LEEVASVSMKKHERRGASAAGFAACNHAFFRAHRMIVSEIPGMRYPPKTAAYRPAD
jgi:hypothetical protein